MHYRIFDAFVNNNRPTLRGLGLHGRIRVQTDTRYIVRDGLEVTQWPTLHDAVVYHGVGTTFTGDILRVQRTRTAPFSGYIMCLGHIGENAAVDWNAYGWSLK